MNRRYEQIINKRYFQTCMNFLQNVMPLYVDFVEDLCRLPAADTCWHVLKLFGDYFTRSQRLLVVVRYQQVSTGTAPDTTSCTQKCCSDFQTIHHPSPSCIAFKAINKYLKKDASLPRIKASHIISFDQIYSFILTIFFLVIC